MSLHTCNDEGDRQSVPLDSICMKPRGACSHCSCCNVSQASGSPANAEESRTLYKAWRSPAGPSTAESENVTKKKIFETLSSLKLVLIGTTVVESSCKRTSAAVKCNSIMDLRQAGTHSISLTALLCWM